MFSRGSDGLTVCQQEYKKNKKKNAEQTSTKLGCRMCVSPE